MKNLIIILAILAIAGIVMAHYPFDLGMHMGISTGGGTGGSFPAGSTLLIEGTSDCILIEGTSDCILLE